MSRRPDDPQVTDLRRYRKARAMQRRRPAAGPPSQRLLGDRPRAGLILLVVILVLAAVWVLPALR
jgi:hypothetical protein